MSAPAERGVHGIAKGPCGSVWLAAVRSDGIVARVEYAPPEA